MTGDIAYKRIQAARVARRCPSILERVADGRLNLTSIVLLRPVLTRMNMDRLLKAAEGMTKEEVKLLIARNFPKPDLPTRIEPLAPAQIVGVVGGELVPEPVEFGGNSAEMAPAQAPSGPMPPPVELSSVEPLTPERFGLTTTIDRETQDDLARALELLGHVSRNQVPEVLKRALRLYVAHLEKQKFAAVSKPRPQARPTQDPRHIPAAVKREVRRRDRDQCTFVAESGHQCEERSGLEFDHIEPVARGGAATVGNLRLRCRAHNQYEAERTFGADFMQHKREQASAATSG
jgi:5-methylcytosine-specific restriction endonuclease McrA